MLGPGWTEVVALAAAFGIAVVATPAGISGAVLLLPFQVGVLGTPSPAVTPTNLLYNVVATPPGRVIPLPLLTLLAVLVGCVGGIYGIGGGSILAPSLSAPDGRQRK